MFSEERYIGQRVVVRVACRNSDRFPRELRRRAAPRAGLRVKMIFHNEEHRTWWSLSVLQRRTPPAAGLSRSLSSEAELTRGLGLSGSLTYSRSFCIRQRGQARIVSTWKPRQALRQISSVVPDGSQLGNRHQVQWRRRDTLHFF